MKISKASSAPMMIIPKIEKRFRRSRLERVERELAFILLLLSVFIERYKNLNPNSDIIQLDAKSLNINRKFDCIYSNKVLIHITKKECNESLNVLTPC